MRRVLAGRRAARRHAGAAARDAVRGDVRPSRLAAAAGSRTSRAAASRTTARSPRASACRRFPRAPRRSRSSTILALVRETGVRVHLCRLSSARGRRDGARREARGPAGHLRRRRPSPAPVRRRHRLVRRAGAPRCRRCAARATAPRCARASPTARSTSSAPTTRRSTTTRSRCRSARRSPAPPGSSCCCRSRSSGRTRTASRLPTRSHASRRAPAALLGVPAGTLATGAPADLCVFDPTAPWRVERRALTSQGKNTPFLGLELAGACPLHAGRRGGRPRGLRQGRWPPRRAPARPSDAASPAIGPRPSGKMAGFCLDRSAMAHDPLTALEQHSIHVIREAYARLKPLGMLWSLGKDSQHDAVARAQGVRRPRAVPGHAARHRQRVRRGLRVPRPVRERVGPRLHQRRLPGASRKPTPRCRPRRARPRARRWA